MSPLRLFSLVFLVYLVESAVYTPPGGPVYINPNAAAEPSLLDNFNNNNEQPDRLTQTVYGFLDFTTTIGNTVMVFSPQSAPANPPKVEKSPEPTTVIETKPAVQPSTEIKPSKTTKSENIISSVVEIKGPQVEIEPQIFSVVEIIGGDDIRPSEINEGTSVLSSKIEIKESLPVKIKKSPPKPIISKIEIIDENKNIISSKVEIKSEPTVKEPVVLSSIVQVVTNDADDKIFSSIVNVKSSDDDRAIEVDANNIDKPEYDFLNRQPSEVVDESFKVINLKPNSKKSRNDQKSRNTQSSRKSDGSQPTGLVTKLGGTVVKEGITTVHETQVIGTFISGKYAQVLQSSSKIINERKKISPSQTQRILKTAAPNFQKARGSLEPTPAGSLQEETSLPLEALFHGDKSSNLIRPSRRPGPAVGGPANGKNDYKQRYRSRSSNNSAREQEISEEYDQEDADLQNNAFKKYRGRNTSAAKPTSSESTSVSSSSSGRKFQNSNRRNSGGGYKSKGKEPVHEKEDSYTRRGFKPKVQSSSVEPAGSSSSLYKFKLQRPSGRWSYKTTPKPRVTIRRQDGGIETNDNNVTPPSQFTPAAVTLDDIEAERRGDDGIEDNIADRAIRLDPTPAATTLRVDISTPNDFNDVYYEIATIRSPYTFQVGTVKNTRYITVTSTFEKTLHPIEPTPTPNLSEPLTENILAHTQAVYDKENNLPLDSSIATLPPISLGTDVETPPLETITETFSTTQLLLKTHILPVIRGGNNTQSYTLVQSYHITRLVTATKTLPPMEVYQFVPSKTLNEFNTRLEEAGSELHLELEFGDDGNQEEDDDDERVSGIRAFPPDLDLANIGNDFDLSSVDKSKLLEQAKKLKKEQTTPKPTTEQPSTTPALSPEQMQQLALLRFINPGATLPHQLLTSSKPVVKIETIYESHVIPLYNGLSTTISRPVSTIAKTEYELVTNSVPAHPTVQQLNPLLPPQPQFSVVSTPVVTNTVITATDSKILKLTFGAKTAYTTLYSTKVVPTVLTTYLTSSIQVAPTAAFQGYFPGPFGGYPGYVG